MRGVYEDGVDVTLVLLIIAWFAWLLLVAASIASEGWERWFFWTLAAVLGSANALFTRVWFRATS